MSVDIPDLIATCLAPGADFAQSRDAAREALPLPEFAVFCLDLEREMLRDKSGQFDASSRLNVLADAVEAIPVGRRDLQMRAATAYIEMRRPALAVHALAVDATRADSGLPFAVRATLRASLAAHIDGGAVQHGHVLLTDYICAHYAPTAGRTRSLIEIGTTREQVPGQQSTLKLAQLCAALKLDFVTVDMDPANSLAATRQMRAAGLPFEAVTAKGEDYLAEQPGPFDFIFLDAYDFDHGNHSGLRQSRYEAHLGHPISDAQCHQMHLDCAQSLVEKLSPDGVICFDDTWTDEAGAWTAKGKLAMPYLLDHGFEVLAAHNNAALLRRKNPDSALRGISADA